MTFCLGLNRLRHCVQHVARFVEPAALLFRRAKDLAQSIPEAQGTIANGEVRRMGEPASAQIKEDFAPALGAFTIAVHCPAVHCEAMSREGARPRTSLRPHSSAPTITRTHCFSSAMRGRK